MCGRYALGMRIAFIRRRLQEQGMQVDDAPDDDDIRETYNFAPGYIGPVYRAETPDSGYEEQPHEDQQQDNDRSQEPAVDANDGDTSAHGTRNGTRYIIQGMKWGLIPFWTKKKPDYGSLMRTINCRDDSLIEDRGMWTSMKKRKRCVVVCQGFYEWLKKGPGGKEKIPHFIKRKDGDLMYFAGLWDCVQYEGSDEKLYTYTIITTDSNPYLKFLHDRMPVILEPNSEAMRTWLDPRRTTWTKELQSILKPYEGELECYPVAKEVGKVGNDSPEFIIPVSSKENKGNIANFFANAAKKGAATGKPDEKTAVSEERRVVKDTDSRGTKDDEWEEDNAPKPVPADEQESSPRGVKREVFEEDTEKKAAKAVKTEAQTTPRKKLAQKASELPEKKPRGMRSPVKTKSQATAKKASDGSQRITNFFKK